MSIVESFGRGGHSLCGLLQLYIHVTSVVIPMIILIPCVPIIIMIMYNTLFYGRHVIDVWGSIG